MKQFKRLGMALGTFGFGAALYTYLAEFRPVDPAPSATKVVMPSQESSADTGIKTATTENVAAITNKQTPIAKQENEDALATDENFNPDYPTLEYRLDEMRARRNGQSFDAAAVKAAMQQPAAWQTDPSAADALNLDNEDRYDGREFIRFSGMKIESLVPGDTMEIPIPQQNATYQMVVDGVRVHTDGNVSWYGHLKDFPSENQVAFTRGNNFTVGGITIQDKQYTLQANGDTGWLVDSFVLFKGTDEHLFPDTPEGSGQNNHQDHEHKHHHDQES